MLALPPNGHAQGPSLLQVGPYLCWYLRPILDAAFQGDVRAMNNTIQRWARPAAAAAAAAAHPGSTSSRGIVVAAGGQQYIANAFVHLYTLRRHLNCTLPVALM